MEFRIADNFLRQCLPFGRYKVLKAEIDEGLGEPLFRYFASVPETAIWSRRVSNHLGQAMKVFVVG